tara:strand:- start:21 stop:677 length:657 start_codon:yes stop_codon:yes gene_type:complete
METRIAKFLTSLGAVIVPMLIIQAALWIDGAFLLWQSFPAIPEFIRIAAAVLLGFGLCFPLLLTSVNSELLKPLATIDFPKIFGLVTVVLSLLFFDVFRVDKDTTYYATRVFLSLLLGLVEYLYSFLFVAKWKEKRKEETFEEQYDDLIVRHHELTSEAKDFVKQNNLLRVKLEAAQTTLNGLLSALRCPHCAHQSDTPGAHRYHVKTCAKNPKNQTL